MIASVIDVENEFPDSEALVANSVDVLITSDSVMEV